MIITYKVVKLSEGHLCANIFAHRDEGDSTAKEGKVASGLDSSFASFFSFLGSFFEAVMWSSQWWSIAWILRMFPVPAKEQASTKICAVFEIG
jgi:hypothetical protein